MSNFTGTTAATGDRRHSTDPKSIISEDQDQDPPNRKRKLTSIATGRQFEIPEADLVKELMNSRPSFQLLLLLILQLGGCRSVAEFDKLNRIGEGTYGVVCEILTRLTSNFFLAVYLGYFDLRSS